MSVQTTVQCPNCGADVESQNAFCKACGYAMKTDAPVVRDVETQIEESSASSPDGVISGTPILLADGERVWREYAVTQLRRRAQGEGKLFVTDLRLIFFAVARPRAGTRRGSTLVFQTKLDQITGLATIVSRRVSFFWVLMTAILGLATLFQLLQGNATAAFVLLVLAAGAGFLVYRSIKLGGSVGLEVHSVGSQPTPVAIGEVREGAGVGFFTSARSFVGSILGRPTAYDVAVGIPGEDAHLVIAELGALIMDLQSKGSLAGERWGVEP
jgi:zinc-ribbon domain